MRRNSSPTDRTDNFESRLKKTMNSELEPEMITPNTAGSEDLPDYDSKFPLVDQFNQTNMHSPKGRSRDHDKQTNQK